MKLPTMARVVAITVALLVPAIGHSTPDEIEHYAAGDGSKLTVHVFLPETDVRTSEAVVLYFGGGWRVGSPQQFYPFCESLVARGFTCFVPDYRVSSRQGTDGVDATADARAAFAWVVSHSERYGVDPAEIYVGGGSAGGHLAAAVAMIPDDTSTVSPKGMLLFNPAVALGTSPRIQAIFRNSASEYSPIEFVREGLPGAWIVHGTADSVVPHNSVVEFCMRMRAASNQCELISFEGEGHGFFNAGRAAYDKVTAALLEHLNQ